jgi:hypothetical protein
MIGTLHVHDLILLRTESAVISTRGGSAAHTSIPNVPGWLYGEAASQMD